MFKALTEAGIDTCFTYPCTSEIQLVCETGQTENARAVLGLEENVMTAAAGGHSRMAGKLATATRVTR